MPRNVRNSWVELDVDGRASTIATGPRRTNGTMTATFYLRNNGDVVRVLTVRQFVEDDGTITFAIAQTPESHALQHYHQGGYTELRSKR